MLVKYTTLFIKSLVGAKGTVVLGGVTLFSLITNIVLFFNLSIALFIVNLLVQCSIVYYNKFFGKSITEEALHAFDSVIINDLSGKCLYASPSVEDYFGYSQEDLIGNSLYDLFNPDEMEELSSYYLEIAKRSFSGSNDSFKTKCQILDKHDNYVTVETFSEVVGVTKDTDIQNGYDKAIIINRLKVL